MGFCCVIDLQINTTRTNYIHYACDFPYAEAWERCKNIPNYYGDITQRELAVELASENLPIQREYFINSYIAFKKKNLE
jgi:hypothetical protein